MELETKSTTNRIGADFPVRCQIDQSDFDGHPVKEMLNYLVIQGGTRMDKLVETLLREAFRDSTEYTESELCDMLPQVKGFVEITHWKPMALDICCKDPTNCTVSEMLENIRTKNLLIRIVLPRTSSKLISETLMRAQLKAMLFSQPGFPAAALCMQLHRCGCPLSEKTILAFLNATESYNFTVDQRQRFQDWHKDFMAQFLRAAAASAVVSSGPAAFQLAAAATVGAGSLWPFPAMMAPLTNPSTELSKESAFRRMISSDKEKVSPLLVASTGDTGSAAGTSKACNVTNSKTPRIRTSFDVDRELPLLHNWFQTNPHPSRMEMEHFRNILNSQSSRLARRPLDLTNIIYWFKNMRANVRRRKDDLESSQFEVDCDNKVELLNVKKSAGVKEEDLQSDACLSEDDVLVDEAENLTFSTKRHLESVDTNHLSSLNDTLPPRKRLRHAESGVKVDKCSFVSSPNHFFRSSLHQNQQHQPLQVVVRPDDADDADDDENDDQENKEKQLSSFAKNNAAVLPQSLPFGFLPNYSQAFSSGLLGLGMTSTSSGLLSSTAPTDPLFHFSKIESTRDNDKSESEMSMPTTPSGNGMLDGNLGDGSESYKRKRTRVFIDPTSEIMFLEKWFAEDTHPTSAQFEAYCDILNKGEFRLKQPRLEPKNIQLWFKNHRAKIKRIKIEQGFLTNSISDHMAGDSCAEDTPLMPSTSNSCSPSMVGVALSNSLSHRVKIESEFVQSPTTSSPFSYEVSASKISCSSTSSLPPSPPT